MQHTTILSFFHNRHRAHTHVKWLDLSMTTCQFQCKYNTIFNLFNTLSSLYQCRIWEFICSSSNINTNKIKLVFTQIIIKQIKYNRKSFQTLYQPLMITNNLKIPSHNLVNASGQNKGVVPVCNWSTTPQYFLEAQQNLQDFGKFFVTGIVLS